MNNFIITLASLGFFTKSLNNGVSVEFFERTPLIFGIKKCEFDLKAAI
jgi:hypothetical protein